MNDFVADGVVERLEVRDVEIPHRLDRLAQGLVLTTALAQSPSRRPQGSKDLRAVEPLSCTVLAEAHKTMVLHAARRLAAAFLTPREPA